MPQSRGTMTPLERLAALKAAAVLQQTTLTTFAASCKVSYNHFSLVVKGARIGSSEVEQRIAALIGEPVARVFPSRGKR
jgi:hypothetical protein